jgi:hypothetical protein
VGRARTVTVAKAGAGNAIEVKLVRAARTAEILGTVIATRVVARVARVGAVEAV